MARCCEVCSALPESERTADTKLRRFLIGERIVLLCDPHGAQVMARRGLTTEQFRSLFIEPDGQRSLVERRAPLDRRAFPPRPEGRRQRVGRRSADHND